MQGCPRSIKRSINTCENKKRIRYTNEREFVVFSKNMKRVKFAKDFTTGLDFYLSDGAKRLCMWLERRKAR